MLVTNFELGEYINIPLENIDVNSRINEIMINIFQTSKIEFNELELNLLLDETQKELEEKLKLEGNTLDLFLVMQKIKDKDELREVLKNEIESNLLEKEIFREIGIKENLKVTLEDIDKYKTEYRTVYGNIKRDDDKMIEEDLKNALLAKKVISHLLILNK